MTGERPPGVRPPGLVTRRSATYNLLCLGLGVYLRVRNRARVEGREHLPRAGGALIVANHQSYADIPLVASSCPRHIAFVARMSLGRSDSLAFIMRECGAIQIERGGGERAALREMVRRLQGGGLVAIFPEGTRSLDGQVGEFQRGALWAAQRANVPIVPAAIRGSGGIFPRGQSLPGAGRIGLRFLPPRSSQGASLLEDLQREIAAVVGSGDMPA